ncbi:hypothetical protein [Nocardia cyriacigeorgica]|uniref:hypothetical protein n=1 Tax=Nocardia cyriacigeorgica TaxID=135487 RepID=UPI0018938C6E|nr:hypothetical protein [Nocardia cyriacigeorgica]MBF6416964.1 hypothetical protein [Nocardia cyriacigeorgica]
MHAIWEWATALEWWQYLLIIYVLGFALTVATNLDTMREALPEVREMHEWQQLEDTRPRVAAGALAFLVVTAALVWPLDVRGRRGGVAWSVPADPASVADP